MKYADLVFRFFVEGEKKDIVWVEFDKYLEEWRTMAKCVLEVINV